MSLNIRPHKLIQAATWLVSNSRQEGITVNQNWGEECNANCSLDDSDIESRNEQVQDIDNTRHRETNINSNKVLEAEIPAGVTDTMLTNTDFVEDIRLF